MLVPFLAPFAQRKLRRRYDAGDATDRLNHQYSTILLIVAALTLMAKQYIGDPLQCWVPAQFTRTWEKYAEMYCYVKNTYLLPLDQHIPQQYDDRDNREIGYYQWVPIMLAFQACMFWLPCMIWRMLNVGSGINVKSVLSQAARIKKKIDAGKRQQQVATTADHIKESLDMQRDLKSNGRISGFFGKHYGCYVTALYLFVKLLYILNVCVQFLILNAFLGPNYTFWGFGILRDLANGVSWEESGHFPRVTMCDFQVRVLGNLHRWTVQCVLMINMFNEKIYIFFWWWFGLVAILSTLSLIYWICAACIKSQQRGFIEKYLRVEGCVDSLPGVKQDYLIDKFVHKSLRPDGVFMLRMIQGNGGDLMTGEIVKHMWDAFRKTDDQDLVDRDVQNGVSEPIPPPSAV